MAGWWLKNNLENYESQWEGLSHILWKIKAMFETTNQMGISLEYDLDQTNYHLVMTNIAMARSTIFKNGKPSISIRAIYTMANC